MPIFFPNCEQELLQRAELAAGYTFADIAKYLNMPMPQNLTKQKGWVGNLIETFLGANAGSKAERDFASLGIELKTIPIDNQGKPLETTFVSVAPLMANHGVIWETSHVKYKLTKVLWIPIQGERTIALADRKVGRPILWMPSPQQEQQLKQDWQELMDMITLGQVEKITARYGTYLQIRPKAANGRALTEAIGENGQIILTRPRGFYLKKSFTWKILNNAIK
ncbi:DNA mismatch repair endonuclease MutH [Gilliamella sp. B3791]|uniref:DNA mismatch repair endonuclease MutH n=1 Tax=unclassified Gilliamella TaxID=2685620 RepID=UPI002269D5D3|nr:MULTISPECIES: DNA mismatch repair endonuclease MutH [unclassified Gilliamella]MCX8643018.1 DNA mismatch repair endonuclease MutH [Gilliamella sp. B3835]MCX8708409.1 DNA mismatch repair endonuclease MutH [Gilliamella sp. B3783]MCX8709891.1 DNA mismatch repair endonuclease MutH [Gilliamella sp. B3780]MCX8712929.1 DNA mismatch repair endonuclease MutH [Gilliamella sp. B3468]MCX8717605.1 DNA mismatch repair endonuclease MutH [Gilliamella sp. B3784]